VSQRAATQDLRGRRLVAPIGLLLAVALLALTAWSLAQDLQVGTATVPVDGSQVAEGAIPERGPQVLAVLQTDELSTDVVGLVEAVTTQSRAVSGVTDVESITEASVITSTDTGITATPTFGSESSFGMAVGLDARTRRAGDGLLGTAGLMTADGHTILVAAEIDPRLSAAEQAVAARAFRDQATLAVSVSGLPVRASFGGEALTVAEATDRARSDLALMVGLACLAPAAIALVVLRRRVPTGALLAAGGSALLLAALLINGEAAQGRVAPLANDHPVSVTNDIVDRELRGTIPVTVDLVGAPGAFRRPDVLARMDALTTWLRSEYGITGVDLPTTLRAEAEAITGVDSIPANDTDIDSLISQTGAFEPALLDDILNTDRSRTRIVAWLPDEGRARLDELANRLDRMSAVVFEDLGIAVEVGAEVVAVTPTRQTLARDLALLGSLAIALGATVALATAWDRHRHEERHRERHRRLFGPGGRHPASSARGRSALDHGHDDQDDHHERRWNRSLFARHDHDRHRTSTRSSSAHAGSTGATDPEPTTSPTDRFDPPRSVGKG
jgi:hypothetical protein